MAMEVDESFHKVNSMAHSFEFHRVYVYGCACVCLFVCVVSV